MLVDGSVPAVRSFDGFIYTHIIYIYILNYDISQLKPKEDPFHVLWRIQPQGMFQGTVMDLLQLRDLVGPSMIFRDKT